jgi:hypothetical protein
LSKKLDSGKCRNNTEKLYKGKMIPADSLLDPRQTGMRQSLKSRQNFKDKEARTPETLLKCGCAATARLILMEQTLR